MQPRRHRRHRALLVRESETLLALGRSHVHQLVVQRFVLLLAWRRGVNEHEIQPASGYNREAHNASVTAREARCHQRWRHKQHRPRLAAGAAKAEPKASVARLRHVRHRGRAVVYGSHTRPLARQSVAQMPTISRAAREPLPMSPLA